VANKRVKSYWYKVCGSIELITPTIGSIKILAQKGFVLRFLANLVMNNSIMTSPLR